MRDVGVGVVGVGRLGYVHAYNFASQVPKAYLAAVCDMDRDLGEATAKEFSCAYYNNVESMLEDKNVDAVCVVTATHQHVAPVEAAAAAGKPVFCDKPLASTLEDTVRLVNCIKDSGVICQVGFHRRFDPDFAAGKEMILDGKIGKPVFIGGHSRDPFPPPPASVDPAKGGGLFFDMMIHDFDIARFLMDDDVESVFGDETNLVVDSQGIERFSDNATASLHFKNGAIGTFHASWHAPYGYDIQTQVHGADGNVWMGRVNSVDVKLSTLKEGITNPRTFQTVGKIPHFMYRFREAYVNEMVAFVDCIIEKKKPLVTEVDALQAFGISLAASKSAEKEAPVTVAEVLASI